LPIFFNQLVDKITQGFKLFWKIVFIFNKIYFLSWLQDFNDDDLETIWVEGEEPHLRAHFKRDASMPFQSPGMMMMMHSHPINV
jgi:hypothetical protein